MISRMFFLVLFCASMACASQDPGPKFSKTKIELGKVHLTVEVADTEEKREYGLMNRPSMTDKEGMIFLFPNSEPLVFWMKDTLIPLSIGFFDDKGILFQIMDMDPASPVELHPKTYMSAKPAKYALEVNKGWFDRKNVRVGTKLKLKNH